MVYFKWVNFIVCKLYLDKVFLKTSLINSEIFVSETNKTSFNLKTIHQLLQMQFLGPRSFVRIYKKIFFET